MDYPEDAGRILVPRKLDGMLQSVEGRTKKPSLGGTPPPLASVVAFFH